MLRFLRGSAHFSPYIFQSPRRRRALGSEPYLAWVRVGLGRVEALSVVYKKLGLGLGRVEALSVIYKKKTHTRTKTRKTALTNST